MSRRLLQSLLLTLVACFACCSSAQAGLMNGDFSVPGAGADPFDSWTTFGFYDIPTDAGQIAQFDITGFFDNFVQLEQTFALPTNAISLSFEFSFSSVPGGVGGFGNDSFQATLFDQFFVPINPIFGGILDGYYSFDSGGFEDTATSGVSVADIGSGVRRVTLDLTTIAPQDVTIDFQMLGDDDGLTSTVLLDNVVLTVGAIPEPTSSVLWAFGGLAILVRSRRRPR